MRYYQIILSISIFALFVSLFSIPIKTLAVEVIENTPDSSAQTSISTGSAIATPSAPAPAKTSYFMSIWGSFINFFKSFTKPYTVQPNNPPSLTNFGNINNSENTYGSVDRSTGYSDQLSQKNQYISEVINGIYEDKTMSLCPGDSDITIKKVAFYLIKVKNTSLNTNTQKETDFLNSPEFINFSIDPSLYSCYDQIYDQFPTVPQGGENNVQNAAGSEQLYNSINLVLPYDKKNQSTQDNETVTDSRDKYAKKNKESQLKMDAYFTPDSKSFKGTSGSATKGLGILRPDGWQ